MNSTLLIADPDPAVLKKMAAYLEKDFKIIGLVEHGGELAKQLVKHQPSHMVMDWNLKSKSGLFALKTLQASLPSYRPQFSIYTAIRCRKWYFKALEYGTFGYWFKPLTDERLYLLLSHFRDSTRP